MTIIEFHSFFVLCISFKDLPPSRNLNTFFAHTRIIILYTILFTKLLLSIKLLSKIWSELFKLKVSILVEQAVVVLVLNWLIITVKIEESSSRKSLN